MSVVLAGPVHFDALCPTGYEMLREAGHSVILHPGAAPYTANELRDLVGEVDAAIVGMETWDGDILACSESLKIVSKLGVGVDNIDLTEARARGIDVTNAPGANANAVAELAVGLLLSAVRKIPAQNALLRTGGWDRFSGFEITGKRIGLIGFGQTARQVVRRLRGFDVDVAAYDPLASPDDAREFGVALLPLSEVLRRSDVISVHTPHLPSTHHLLSTEQFSTMRPGSVLVNTSRGGVVDEDALADALRSGHLGAAGIDVWETEPVDPSHPLLAFENVVATCHSAADTDEAYENVGRVVCRAIIDRLSGRTPENIRNTKE